jgi:hypothetical protein
MIGLREPPPAAIRSDDRPPIILAREAEEAPAAAERLKLEARWASLPEARRARITEAVERANPALLRFPLIIKSLCYEMMLSEPVRSAGSRIID